MRLDSIAARIFLAVFAMLCVIGDAHAQSFFEKLFGGSGAKRVDVPNGARMRRSPSGAFNARRPGFSRHRQSQRHTKRRSGSGGRYRTMCVRMCDGYYWPVSSSVRRSKFRRDANICRSRCGEDAKLFYHPANAGKVDNMVNLAGQRYKSLDVAFQYRKKLVEGCRCRPESWSFSERARHAGYQAEEAYAEHSNGSNEDITNPIIAGVYELENKPDPAGQTPVVEVVSYEKTDTEVELESETPVAAAGSKTKTPGDELPFVAMQQRSMRRASRASRKKAFKRNKQRRSRTAAQHKRKPSKKASFSFFTPSPGEYRYPGD